MVRVFDEIPRLLWYIREGKVQSGANNILLSLRSRNKTALIECMLYVELATFGIYLYQREVVALFPLTSG